MPFRVSRQPVVGLLFDEFDRGTWNEIYIAAPSQSSKSFCGFVIPTLRDIHELRLDTVCGVPVGDMFSDKWDKDFLPPLQASPELRHLIPARGPGAKGGRIKDRVTLGNKVDIKVISASGGDASAAGFSAPRVHLTEAAGWSHSPEGSVEGGKFRQVQARLRAFSRNDPRRLLTVEGTFTIDEELPAIARGANDDEAPISTQSEIVCQCPHCPAFISPGRQYLQGWQKAASILEAMENAHWVCPDCGQRITDDERRAAMATPILLHRGQKINKRGKVTGEMPPTDVLWFAWTGWHNFLLGTEDLAADEWRGEQIEPGTLEKENAERALCQFSFGQTFKSTLVENEKLDAKVIRERKGKTIRNLLPYDTEKLTIGIDIGDWTAWAFAIAHCADGRRVCPNYWAFDVKRSKNDDLESRIIAALDEFSDEILEQGFPQEGTDGLYLPDKVLIDGGYMPDAVAEFVRGRGGVKQKRYYLARGRGETKSRTRFTQKTKRSRKNPQVGSQWYAEANFVRRIIEITFDADHWKLALQALLRGKPGRKGGLAFFSDGTRNEHAKVSNHLANEQFVLLKTGKMGWRKTGDNHWLDGGAMAMVAGDMAGVSLISIPDDAPPNFYANLLGAIR